MPDETQPLFTLTLTQLQAEVNRDALDVFGRLLSGELQIPLEQVWREIQGGWEAAGNDLFHTRLDDLSGILWGLERGCWKPLNGKVNHLRAHIAFETFKVVRKALYLAAGGDPNSDSVITLRAWNKRFTRLCGRHVSSSFLRV